MRWLSLLVITLLTGALAWVGPTAQADAADIETATTLSAPASGVYGDTPLLTATVTPSGATGSVDFFEGDLDACQDVPVAADGTAECQLPGVGVGTFDFRADFHGDAPYADSSGSATTVIGRAPTSIEYTGTLTATVGEPLRLEAVLSVVGGDHLYGYQVNFYSGETPLCGGIGTPDGSMWCLWTPTETGATTVTAVFAPGDFGNYEPTSTDADITVTDTPQQTATTTALSAPSPVEFGLPVTVAASVSPNPGAGTVDFVADGSSICSNVAVTADGSASCVAADLGVGAHTFTAAFSGTATSLPSTSAPVSTEVTKALTDLRYDGDNAGTADSPVQLRAILMTAVSHDPVGPGATVTFTVDDQFVCQAETDSGGVVGCRWTPAEPGPVTLRASYAGSDTYLPSLARVPLAVDRASSTVTVTASPTSASWSDPIVITADVPSGATGTVAFRSGADGLAGCAAVPITDAFAQCTVSSLDVGTHTVTAEYSGDADHADGSGSTDVTVTARSTTVSYTGAATGTVGAQVAVSALVLDEATSDPRGGAAITFELDGTSCQATTSADGTASCTLTAPQAGNRTVSLDVDADAHHAAGATTADVRIDAADTQVTVQAPDSIDVSLPATITAVVAPADGGTVDFSVGQDPITGCVDVPVTETDGQWSAECVTDALDVGAVTVSAAFSGTNNYSPATGSASITVHKAPTDITYTGDTDTVVGGRLHVGATLTDVVGGGSEAMAGQTLTFTLGDLTCTAGTDDDGAAVCDLVPTRAAESGSLTVEFAGTLTHRAAAATAAVTVSPAPTTVTLTTPEQTTYSAPVTLSATVAPGNGEGTVDFAVADRPLAGCTAIAPESVDGAWQATCLTTELPVGDASVSAAYSGTDDYLYSFDTAVIVVSPAATALQITGPSTVSVGQPAEFGARLVNLATDAPAAGLSVTFEWGGWECTATTDDEGLATCSTTPTSEHQTGTLTVEFAGTAEFVASAATAEISVDPAATVLVYSGRVMATAGVPFTASAVLSLPTETPGPDTVADYAPRLLDARALIPAASPEPPSVAGQSIVFTAGSQQCTGQTDDSGRAECELSVDAAGSVTLTVTFAGTDQLAAAQTQARLDTVAPATSAPSSDDPTRPTASPTPTATSAGTGTVSTSVPTADGPAGADASAGPPLSVTGFSPAPWIAIGLLLLAAGIVVLQVARRRDPSRHH